MLRRDHYSIGFFNLLSYCLLENYGIAKGSRHSASRQLQLQSNMVFSFDMLRRHKLCICSMRQGFAEVFCCAFQFQEQQRVGQDEVGRA